MQFKTEDAGDDIAIVRGDGRLNMVSAPELRETVKRSIDSGRSRIVVDMSRVQFMDSSGLGALIACLKSARQAGGDLKIVSPSAQVQMVLALSNVDQVLPPHESVAEAYGV
ncbi:STAS domain-containing protein [Cnuibacter sp. UC19_7]|uniref:STAS domain-containing protein n=1 Tax=Cnuibacter sp. UC19_7 TaxID=3350166 RepID=UPI0036728BCF